jgi:hypothetical protein
MINTALALETRPMASRDEVFALDQHRKSLGPRQYLAHALSWRQFSSFTKEFRHVCLSRCPCRVAHHGAAAATIYIPQKAG